MTGGHGRDGGDTDVAGARPARDIGLLAVESLQQFVSHPPPGLLDTWPAADTLPVAVDADDRLVGYLLGVGAHLTKLAVSPDHRREGRATTLVEAFRSTHHSGTGAANAPLTLLVHPGDDGTHACYEALGFRRDTRALDAFGGDDGLRLALD